MKKKKNYVEGILKEVLGVANDSNLKTNRKTKGYELSTAEKMD